MQDHIPDALIAAFERQYDTTWNDPQLRNERLAMRYGWAAAMEAKQCLHQVQEPTPATALDALREAEATQEVAMARILKANPGHSISVTSEAKALVIVRDALAATPAAAEQVPQGFYVSTSGELKPDVSVYSTPAAAPVVLPEPVAAIKDVMELVQSCIDRAVTMHTVPTLGINTIESKLRALLATGGQAPALYVSKDQLDAHRDPDGPDSDIAGRYLPCRITPAGKFTTPLFAAPQVQALEVDDHMALAFHHAITDGAIGQDDLNEIKIGLRAVLVNLHAPQAQADARDAIRDLIAIHSAELKQNEYAYFELAHTRQTGWCAWITDHPRSMPPMPTVNPDRKVIASGQGDTPEEACSAAIAAAKGE